MYNIDLLSRVELNDSYLLLNVVVTSNKNEGSKIDRILRLI